MTFDIETAILHRDYNSRTAENDIALLKTTEAMPLLSKNSSSQLDVNNICLPGQDEQFEGKATISGFGRTSYLGSPSGQLLAAEVDLQPDANCVAHYSGDYKFKGTTMVCAGDQDGGGRSSCHGDSGGPLYQTQNGRDVLIGVTSFGRGCGRNGAPTVYTRVSSYLDWINQQTAAN
ncbi:Trypsin-1 [Halotydeus destructor]|nr:Trypsin-1 [Halotydeus destructor]